MSVIHGKGTITANASPFALGWRRLSAQARNTPSLRLPSLRKTRVAGKRSAT